MNSLSNISNWKNSPIFLWTRVFLWCAVIYCFSSVPNYKGKVVNFETLGGILEFAFRKSCHLGEYFLLMVFTSGAVQNSGKGDCRWHFLLSFFLVLLYSISDEWHQTFVFGRTGSVMDVFIDSLGSVAGYFHSWRWSRALEGPEKPIPAQDGAA